MHVADESPSHADTMEPDELLEAAQEDFMNYRLFRYTGSAVPNNLDEAFRLVLARYFLPPRYVWLDGDFIDMASVAEVLVGGKAIYQTNASGAQLARYSSPELRPSSGAAAAPSYAPRRDMVCSRPCKRPPTRMDARFSA